MVTKTRLVLVLCALLALTVGVVTAAAGGGNSANAKACQKGGWKKLLRADGSSFAAETACVSYAAHGGVLIAKTKSQLDCEASGGTFSTDPSTTQIGGVTAFFWTCNRTTRQFLTLAAADCQNDGGDLWGLGSPAGPSFIDLSCVLSSLPPG